MTSKVLITTQRTFLTTPSTLTLSQVTKLDSDPEIMQFITGGKTRSILESELWLQLKKEEYNKNGYGLMPAFLKSDNSFVGWGVLKHFENTDKIEIGYRLDKKYWGKRLATEISFAIVEFAKSELDIQKLVAVTDLDNHASKKVLKNCGFKFISKAFHYDSEVDYFELKL